MWYYLFLVLLTLASVSGLTFPHINITEIPSNQLVDVSIVVPPKNLALLETYVQQHVIINKTELYELFIPQEQINEIVNYLKSQGINPTVTLNVISFQATASKIETVLHGEFIVTSVFGKKVYYFINSGDFPGIVLATNLTYALFSKPSNIINITQAVAYNEILPNQIQQAYNITFLLNNGINGSGVNIGILDFEGDPYITQQLEAFDSKYQLPNPPLSKIVPIGPYNPNDGIASGWALEISLDVEYAHVAAPGAGIILYVANPSISIPQAIAYIDQQDEVSVVSQSWGIPEIYFLLGLIPLSYLQSMIYEYWLGEVEGITFIAASGDAGGNGYNFYLSPLGANIVPSSIPYVLSVGGTSLYVAGNQTYQTAWSGESVFGSTTGGYSSLFSSPPYQGLKGFRETPDVVADANPYTGVPVLYYYNITYLVGGTSLATPIVAGILALAIQVHGKLGFVNPLIYSLEGTKALVPVTFGYNTPYVANSSYNPVTGLGYINAGYFVNLLKVPSISLSIATYNMTFLPNQQIKIVGFLKGVSFKPLTLTAYIYNGSDIVATVTLIYNGSAYVGTVSLPNSGIYEIYAYYGNYFGFTYIIVGYQAIFLFPVLAIYPIPSPIPVLAIVTYPNGTLVQNFNYSSLIVYKENQINGELEKIKTENLTSVPIINISLLNITIKYKTGILEGYVNLTNTSFGGVYVLKIKDTIGLDEIVLGMYVVPIVIPNSFTEPISAYSVENVTLYVFVESLGMPNITVSFIKDGITYYTTQINAITYDGSSLYITQISLPPLPSGYYIIKAYANYSNGSYIAYGEGFTQLYISSASLRVEASINSVAFENDTVTINAKILYPNGSIVKFGTFSAIFIPSYLTSQLDNIELSYSVSLVYENGSWVGTFTIPAGNYDNSGVTVSQISGEWNVYIVGVASNGVPLPFDSSLNINTLSIQPVSSSLSFLVLPYNYQNNFTGTFAYKMYINNAIITDKTAIFVDSIINNLTAINSTIYAYNTEINHINLINSKIYKYKTPNSTITTIINQNKTLTITNSSSTQSQNKGQNDYSLEYLTELLLALAINISIVILFMLRKR